MIVLCLARQDAVELWKLLMGPELSSIAKISSPTSLRAIYGEADNASKNAVYGSTSGDDVRHDLQFFFPNSKQWNMRTPFTSHFSRSSCHIFHSSVIQEPISTTDRISNYLCSVIYQPLTDALYEMTKAKPDDPLLWLAKFMLEHNHNKPAIRETSPQTLQCVMEMKETEGTQWKQKHNGDEEPAKCGCYLMSKSSSLTSHSGSNCSNKFQWKLSTPQKSISLSNLNVLANLLERSEHHVVECF